jgi:hypothetical protein
MIKYEFEDKYQLVPTTIMVCEDTARCLIRFPNWKNKDEIIKYIDKNNYICAGVYSSDEELLKEMNFYLAGDMITTLEDYNLLERQFT